jgi:hypothetical protein
LLSYESTCAQSSKLGIEPDGIIGFDLLSFIEVTISYDRKRITLGREELYRIIKLRMAFRTLAPTYLAYRSGNRSEKEYDYLSLIIEFAQEPIIK